MAKVYLDALLPREDFDIDETQSSATKKVIFSISDLRQDDFFYSSLRKPDFQRETNEWTPDKVSELIKSFVYGELIPAIILWRSKSGYNFVIDGSHRVSSLIAWINNDYGDGELSKKAFDGIIPEEQIDLAQKTRKVIGREIGHYIDFKLALTNPDKVKPEIVSLAKGLGSIGVQLQWVEGDAEVAEASFFKINQQAAKIDSTELKLIQSRRLPNGIASRAIIKGGKGHQYWSKFNESNISEIVSLSKEIYEILFLPKLTNPVKSLDLPVGGKGFSSTSPLLIFEFVSLVNKNNKNTNLEDNDGTLTVEFLKRSRKIAYLINGNHISSLGLHPAVYFYSRTGRHKTASFFAITDFLMELESQDKLKSFISIREKFEDILIDYDFAIQQILRQYRGSANGVPHIKKFYIKLMTELLLTKKDKELSIKNVLSKDEFKFIKVNENDSLEITSNKFSDQTKSAVFITEALEKALRCKICNSRVHSNSISFDHKYRKQDGGKGNFDNAQITHPYCNSAIKN